ncbi:Hypothetical protein A7982_03721 [Minicystis rosea]|nr:Hypothetical protein A7982_03721 [Minicystis rosea]
MSEHRNGPAPDEHLPEQAFADFVMGAASPAEALAFEAHVARCDACTSRLAREATLELALADVARAEAMEVSGAAVRAESADAAAMPASGTEVAAIAEVAASSTAARSDANRIVETVAPNVAARAGGARPGLQPLRFVRLLPLVAAAAAVWAAFVHRAPSAEASGPIPNAVCPDGPAQEGCVARAHRHGLFVAYPSRAGAPRFEGRARSAGRWSGPRRRRTRSRAMITSATAARRARCSRRRPRRPRAQAWCSRCSALRRGAGARCASPRS